MKQTRTIFIQAWFFALSVSVSSVLAADQKAVAGEAPPVDASESIGPKMVLEDWDWIERDLSIEVAKELDEKYPRFKKGDQVEWTLVSGVVEKGVYEWASSNYVTIIRNKIDVTLPFEKLGYNERLGCDFNFRKERVALQSRIQTRATLIENGVRLPGMPDPKKKQSTPRVSAKPEPLEDFDILFDSADPRAHTEMGMRFLQSSDLEPDPAYAIMYFRAAANQGDAHGMYNLGVLYYKGIGIFRNQNIALGLFTTAGKLNHPTAKATLSKLKVSAAKQREAQKRYDEAAAKYAKKSAEVANRYNRMLQAQPVLRQNRVAKRFDGAILRRTEVNRSNRNKKTNKRRK
jgi:hypothetical protein